MSAATPGNGQSPQLDPRTQLALGTLALEDTPNAVTAEQAQALLPRWKAADSLTGADNVASEEMSGLFNQIEEGMTAEQVQAIQALDLSGQAMADLASQYGFQMGGGGGPGNLTPEMQSTLQAARASGQAPEGFPLAAVPRRIWAPVVVRLLCSAAKVAAGRASSARAPRAAAAPPQATPSSRP